MAPVVMTSEVVSPEPQGARDRLMATWSALTQ